MPGKIIEELSRREREILLKSYGYDVDKDGYVLNIDGTKVRSQEQPLHGVHIDSVLLVPGSLEVLDGTATAVAKYLREKVEPSD
jgi:hypothetical protein